MYARLVSALSLVCALAVVCALAASAVRADDAATRQRIEELERRQKELQAEMERQQKELQAELERLRQEVDKPREQEQAEQRKVEEVERRQGILTDELRRLRDLFVLPETKEMKSYYGLGPAASKVYGIQRGLSLGGYGEAAYKHVFADADGSTDEFDYGRLVLYAGYKFNDWIVFNSEIEFEHATTNSTVSSSDGSVSVEFATVDLLFDPRINARFGLVLVPMGFLNEVHEPPFYHGNARPELERRIIPTTWRSNGFGLFGELLPGLEYRTYGITSFNAEGYRPNGVRDARQSGNRERAEDWSWVARVDYTPIPQWDLGGSLYMGNQGQGELYGNPDSPDGLVEAGVFTQIYEAHTQVLYRGLEGRILFAIIDVDDANILSQNPALDGPIADVMLGYYFELAYDVLPLIWVDTTQYLAPWFRYELVNTQNKVPVGFMANDEFDNDFIEFGLDYKPISQVVFKLDLRFQDAKVGTLPDELRVGGGFVF